MGRQGLEPARSPGEWGQRARVPGKAARARGEGRTSPQGGSTGDLLRRGQRREVPDGCSGSRWHSEHQPGPPERQNPAGLLPGWHRCRVLPRAAQAANTRRRGQGHAGGSGQAQHHPTKSREPLCQPTAQEGPTPAPPGSGHGHGTEPEGGRAGAGAAHCPAASTRVPTGTWHGLRQGSTNGPWNQAGKDVTGDTCDMPQALLWRGSACPAQPVHGRSVACLGAAAAFCSAQRVPGGAGTAAPRGWHCCSEERSAACRTVQQPHAQTRSGRSGDDVQKGSSRRAARAPACSRAVPAHRSLRHLRATAEPGWPLPGAPGWPLLAVPGWPLPGASVIPRWNPTAPRAARGWDFHWIFTFHRCGKQRGQQPVESPLEPPPPRGSRQARQSKQGSAQAPPRPGCLPLPRPRAAPASGIFIVRSLLNHG